MDDDQSSASDEDDPLITNKESHDDVEMLESDYVLLPDPVSLMSVTPISILDSTEITNHIVVCGIHPSIYYFILPLRAKYLKEL